MRAQPSAHRHPLGVAAGQAQPLRSAAPHQRAWRQQQQQRSAAMHAAKPGSGAGARSEPAAAPVEPAAAKPIASTPVPAKPAAAAPTPAKPAAAAPAPAKPAATAPAAAAPAAKPAASSPAPAKPAAAAAPAAAAPVAAAPAAAPAAPPAAPARVAPAAAPAAAPVAPQAPMRPALSAASLSVGPGAAAPLGASPSEDESKPGVNFALWAPNATAVTLCLSDWEDAPLLEAPMARDGDVWTALVEGLPAKGVLYGYKVNGKGGWDTPFRWDANKILLDPYAKYVKGRAVFGQRDKFEQFQPRLGSVFRGTYDFESPIMDPFDWGRGYKRPDIPLKDLIIAELPVRLFTASPTSGLPEGQRGTFRGVAAKAAHLKSIGINAVELLPVFEYDELEFQRVKNPRDHMVNVWGYSHANFFAPQARFAADGGGPLAAAREFKEMVRALHAEGIEVILDVVYNHTVEGGDDDPYLLSWRGIDAQAYYQQDPEAYTKLLNYSGCGNTVNANHPATLQQIVESLRWWVEEYHVDGFRFDLAPCLCRDAGGKVMSNPPLIRAITKDPVLSQVKLISEPWDIGAYMVGSFPNWDIWAEWNGKYRDDVRRFLRGDGGLKSEFATRLAGSADLYHTNQRKPYHSINFIVCHDGFTLADLVSYNEKHNDANGESNRDGTNDNFSWNCGVEGATSNAAIVSLRRRQMRNMHLALMMSQGTPMVLIGDEYGQTRSGNNNYYGHDTRLTHYDWAALEEAKADGWFRFYSGLIQFRQEHPLLGRAEFLTPQDVSWHEDRWDDPEGRFLAFTLHDRGQGGGSLYAAFNAHSFEIRLTLPEPPKGHKWCRVVDTNLAVPKDYTPGGNNGVDPVYFVQPYSSILLMAKPLTA